MKFRRQYPFDKFILDFYAPSLRLAVELDGSQHESADGIAHDAERTAQLEGWGLRVLRFSNREVFENSDAVLHQT